MIGTAAAELAEKMTAAGVRTSLNAERFAAPGALLVLESVGGLLSDSEMEITFTVILVARDLGPTASWDKLSDMFRKLYRLGLTGAATPASWASPQGGDLPALTFSITIQAS